MSATITDAYTISHPQDLAGLLLSAILPTIVIAVLDTSAISKEEAVVDAYLK